MNTFFSILLPTYKLNYLQECIDSIMAQTYSNWELVIVNDASPEDIDSVIQKYTDTRIRYYRNAQNFGAKRLVEQWNHCLSLAKGEYIICMGDDDMLAPHCLETYAQRIADYPEVDILHGQTDIIDQYGQLVKHTPVRPAWESAMSLLYNRTYHYFHQFIGDFCYKKEALQACGGFYYLPYAWGSDNISAVRAAEKAGIANTEEVVFYYRDNSESITRSTHTWGKLRAIWLEAFWVRRFLQQPVSTIIDKQYQHTLRNHLWVNTLRKCYYVLYRTWHRH